MNITDMTQTELIYNLLADGKAQRTDEILRVVYGSEHTGIPRIGATFPRLRSTGT